MDWYYDRYGMRGPTGPETARFANAQSSTWLAAAVARSARSRIGDLVTPYCREEHRLILLAARRELSPEWRGIGRTVESFSGPAEIRGLLLRSWNFLSSDSKVEDLVAYLDGLRRPDPNFPAYVVPMSEEGGYTPRALLLGYALRLLFCSVEPVSLHRPT